MERVARERIFPVSYCVVVSKMVYLQMLMVSALDRGLEIFSHSEPRLFSCMGRGAFEWKGKE